MGSKGFAYAKQFRVFTEGNKVALQGNLDPLIMTTNADNIITAATTILDDYGNHPGHIFNLGHGITPDVPPEHVEILIETVHNY